MGLPGNRPINTPYNIHQMENAVITTAEVNAHVDFCRDINQITIVK